MKVVLPWTAGEQAEREPLPDGVQVVTWAEGDPPDDALDADLLVVPFAGRTTERLAMFRRLRVVQTQSAGVDWIVGRTPHGATLCDAAGVHDDSVAEWALAAILACVRDLPTFVRQQDRAEWRPHDIRELSDRRVLILGYGSIGRAVERRLEPFGVKVVRVARTARDGVHGMDQLPWLLPEADVVVVLVPLTDETRGMVHAGFLAALPDGALLVNAARGAVVDQQALVAELQSGRITAALDVTVPEPLPADDPLWRVPGLLLTPHVGGDTLSLRPRLLRFVREQVERLLAGEPLVNVVENGY